MTSKLIRSRLHPRPRFPQHLEQFPFLTFGIRADFTTVLPPRRLWQAHQDTLDARARRHQAELGTAVMHQVKLDIAAAAEELPAALCVRALRECAAAEDGEVRGDERVAGSAHKVKDGVRGPRTVGEARVGEALVGRIAEVVEEEPADAAGLAAVRNEEVLVAPRLEVRVQLCTVRIARSFQRLVEVPRIVVVEVRWGEVGTATEPPCEHLARLGGLRHLEVAVVGMHSWRVRVAWVDDE